MSPSEREMGGRRGLCVDRSSPGRYGARLFVGLRRKRNTVNFTDIKIPLDILTKNHKERGSDKCTGANDELFTNNVLT